MVNCIILTILWLLIWFLCWENCIEGICYILNKKSNQKTILLLFLFFEDYSWHLKVKIYELQELPWISCNPQKDYSWILRGNPFTFKQNVLLQVLWIDITSVIIEIFMILRYHTIFWYIIFLLLFLLEKKIAHYFFQGWLKCDRVH